MSQTYRFPAHLQTTKFITYNVPSHKGFCLNLLAICSFGQVYSGPGAATFASKKLNQIIGKQQSISLSTRWAPENQLKMELSLITYNTYLVGAQPPPSCDPLLVI